MGAAALGERWAWALGTDSIPLHRSELSRGVHPSLRGVGNVPKLAMGTAMVTLHLWASRPCKACSCPRSVCHPAWPYKDRGALNPQPPFSSTMALPRVVNADRHSQMMLFWGAARDCG